jgi:hypothetical protein
MTASSYGQAYMGGAGMGSMLGGQHPMMQRQNLLDEIQKKFPDPSTPEELDKLVAELSKNGFGDLAMQVKQVSMEMSKNEATKAYQTSQLGKPTADDWKKVGRTLEGSILNTDVTDAYLMLVEPQLVAYDNNTYKGGKDNFNSRRESRLGEVKNLIQQFADDYQGGFNKTQIEEAIGNDAALTEKFIEWIGTHGNADVAGNILKAMGRENPRDATSGAGAGGGGGGSGDTGKVEAVVMTKENKKDFPITSTWTEQVARGKKEYLEGLLEQGGNLSEADKKQLEELNRRFPVQLTRVDDWFLDPNMGYQPPVDVLPTQGYGFG